MYISLVFTASLRTYSIRKWAYIEKITSLSIFDIVVSIELLMKKMLILQQMFNMPATFFFIMSASEVGALNLV